LTDASIVAIGSGSFAGRLLSLDVSHNYQLTDACWPALLLCTVLEELLVKKCLRLTDKGAWSIVCPRKTAVDISRSAVGSTPSHQRHHSELQITISLIEAAPLHVSKLHALDLSGCRLTDLGARKLADAWPRDTRIIPIDAPSMLIRSASQPLGRFTSDATSAAATDSSNLLSSVLLTPPLAYVSELRSLAMNECHHLSDVGLAALLPLFPHLTSIALVGCHRITDKSLAYMATFNRECIGGTCSYMQTGSATLRSDLCAWPLTDSCALSLASSIVQAPYESCTFISASKSPTWVLKHCQSRHGMTTTRAMLRR
jgi:hypothetical protein